MIKESKLEFRGGQWISTIPFIVFILAVIAFSIFKSVSLVGIAGFGVVGIIIASIFAKDQDEYWNSVIKGITSETTGLVVAIFLVVGIFSQLMTVGKISGGFIWLSDILGMKGSAFCAFVFIISALFGVATGSSVGTLVTMVPILYPTGLVLGSHPIYLLGAIISGAAFGDSIAPISDVSIISSSSQKYKNREGSADIGAVVKDRFKYVILASVITFVLYIILGGNSTSIQADSLLDEYIYPKGLFMIIPPAIVIYLAVKGKSIFTALSSGIISGLIVGLATNIFAPTDIINIVDGNASGIVVDGVSSVLETAIAFITVMAMYNILQDSGIIEDCINKLGKSINTPKASEIFILIFVTIINLITAGITTLTAAISGPIVDSIGKTQNIHPFRRGSLVSSLTNTLGYFIPWSISLFLCISMIGGMQEAYSFIQVAEPSEFLLSAFYPLLLWIIMFISVITGIGTIYEGKDGSVVKSNKNKQKYKYRCVEDKNL